MTSEEWRKEIIHACKEAGTYQAFFDHVIDTLSQIMESRDKAHEQFIETGANPTIIHTNKAKERNVVKNPILVMENELNAQALAYWRDLGLTPSGLKKLNAEVVEKKTTIGGFETILKGMLND